MDNIPIQSGKRTEAIFPPKVDHRCTNVRSPHGVLQTTITAYPGYRFKKRALADIRGRSGRSALSAVLNFNDSVTRTGCGELIS